MRREAGGASADFTWGESLVYPSFTWGLAPLPGVYMVEGEVLQLDLVYMAKNNRRHVDPLIAL